MCRAVLPDVMAVAPDTLVLAVTNPVDVVTRAALEVTGLDPARVVGSGTVLDTSRLRRLLSERCGVAVQNVHAYIVGEHGDSEVALWSSATIGGVPLDRWGPGLGGVPTEAERHEMLDDVRRGAYRIVEGKGATNYAIGVMTARIIEAVDHDERRVLTVSTITRPTRASRTCACRSPPSSTAAGRPYASRFRSTSASGRASRRRPTRSAAPVRRSASDGA
jgi:L-lactate dehydrogenase